MKELDYFLVPSGLAVFISYNVWLLFAILRHPKRTVIGLNADSRRQWILSMMTDPLKNGILVVQTIRNNIMASSLMATAAITLCSLISVQLSNRPGFPTFSSEIGNGFFTSSSVKLLALLICFLLAFICNIQSIRYYAHVSFLATLPTSKDKKESIDYVSSSLSRGSYFWSMGLRAFYLSFTLFIWLFGAIPMFLSCCVMSVLLYFLDTTSYHTQLLHSHSINGTESIIDVEVLVRDQ